MDTWTLQQAQKSIEQMIQCQNPRCVFDFFSSEVSKNLREDIYIFLKDHGPVQVQKTCDKRELPKKVSLKEICFSVKLKSNTEIQVLWKNESGEWKLSNASKRKSSESAR